MKISILTLFPEMFQGPLDFSIVKKARDKKIAEIDIINIRDFGFGKHKIVDDTPYGGGIGMILRPDVLHKAIEYAKRETLDIKYAQSHTHVILLSATGKTFNQKKAKQLSKLDHLIFISGHYEGVDERIKKYTNEEISIGDFITTGGEIPTMLIIDSVVRLLPNTLKNGVTDNESFSLKDDEGQVYLEYPQYTKPPVFDNMSVPAILLSGNHKKIQDWRMNRAREKTQKHRYDLLTRRKSP